MKTEGHRQSDNILYTAKNPLHEFWQNLVANLMAVQQIPVLQKEVAARMEKNRREEEARMYYKFATGRDPSEEFFAKLLSGEYVPSSKLGDIGYFIMSNNPAPDSDGSRLSLGVPPGSNALMTREEGKTFLRTGPQRR